MVESNHKCNQLFVTYFNIRQRIHRFLKGFWATEKSVNFSVHFTLGLFSKKNEWIQEVEFYLPSKANHHEVISYGWGAREIVVCFVINNVEQTLPNLSGSIISVQGRMNRKLSGLNCKIFLFSKTWWECFFHVFLGLFRLSSQRS